MAPADKTLLNSKHNQGDSYLDDLAFAVSVNGESLEKYKKIVEKKYGTDTYAGMEQFAMTLQQQVNRGQFTNTSLLNLKYVGKNAGLSEDAIDMITDYFDSKVKEEQRIHKEDEYWNNCPKNDRNALLGYLKKYPKGRYVAEAHARLNIIHREDAIQADMTSWKKVNKNNKRQLKEYLKQFPAGQYVTLAESLIEDLERIEKEAIAENRMFNQCRTQRDYMDYLSKYPNGAYSAKAKSFIEEFGRKEIEESRAFNLCKDKRDYQDYIKKYPNGKYAKEAQTKIKAIENADNRKREETEYWNKCNHSDKQSLKAYLRKYPNGMYAIQAKSHVADIERIENDAIEESRMYNQCRSKSDYLDYLQKYPNGYYRNKAMYEIDMLHKASQKERNSFIQEQETYEQCKTKDDYLRYLSLYPNGKFAARAKNKIEHLEKIEKIKEKQQEELSTDDQNVVTEKESIDTVPDEIKRKLKNLNKIAGYSYGIAVLAFAFLPNAFRGNHWAYLEMEEYGDEPTLWLFWLSIVVSIWCCFSSPANDVFSSIHKTHYVMKGSFLLDAIPCSVMLIWMLITGYNVSMLMGVYLEDIHMFFMGPIICGISWCVGLYCEYKMSLIAKSLNSGNSNQSKSN